MTCAYSPSFLAYSSVRNLGGQEQAGSWALSMDSALLVSIGLHEPCCIWRVEGKRPSLLSTMFKTEFCFVSVASAMIAGPLASGDPPVSIPSSCFTSTGTIDVHYGLWFSVCPGDLTQVLTHSKHFTQRAINPTAPFLEVWILTSLKTMLKTTLFKMYNPN